jgi:replicative DNA helicase
VMRVGEPGIRTEQALLASMLEYPEAYYQAAAMGLRPEHFSDPENRLVFRTILQLAERHEPITFESVVQQLAKVPESDKIIAVVGDLANPLHLPRKNVEWHIKQLQDASRRSRFIAACQAAIAGAGEQNVTTSECMENLQQHLLELQADAMSYQTTKLSDFLPQVLRNLEDRASHKGLIGLPTGIRDLDEATTGIRPGELWVIGAMSGRGKTALGAQVALANVSSGNSVAFFSLEMTREELGDRFLCNESTVPASRIRNPSFITGEQWREIAECSARLAEWNLFVDDSSCLTVQALIARARLLIRRFGCKLVVVDYLRLIRAPGRELREQVGNVADALRQLAKSEHVGVIALSQLARPKDRNINSRPTMLGLKESGDIEAHAHVVLLIHSPAKKGEPTGEDEIIIGKNRHGPIGGIDVTFSRDRLKFLCRDDNEQPEGNDRPLFEQAVDTKTVGREEAPSETRGL